MSILTEQGIRVTARQTLSLATLQVCFLKSSQTKTFGLDKIILVNSPSFPLTAQHIHILAIFTLDPSVIFILMATTNLQNYSIALENNLKA